MMTIKSTLRSMRLRTLPLSLSGVVVGVALASTIQTLEWITTLFLSLTAALLQVVSNLSNELGDTLHGTDAEGRQGMVYSLQVGDMTVEEMRRLIAVMVGLCCVSGLLMIWCSFDSLWAWQPLFFVVLGAAALWAAMHYTLGKNPYGYRGLGDLFVFLFFGIVAVLGSAYICGHNFHPLWLLPACAIGFFSMGVLNVNNIRDMQTDAATRTTVALKLGLKRSRIYHTLLLTLGWGALLLYTALTGRSWMSWLYVATLPLYGLHLREVWRREQRQLDPMLPLLVMSTFALALLFAVGNTIV